MIKRYSACFVLKIAPQRKEGEKRERVQIGKKAHRTLDIINSWPPVYSIVYYRYLRVYDKARKVSNSMTNSNGPKHMATSPCNMAEAIASFLTFNLPPMIVKMTEVRKALMKTQLNDSPDCRNTNKFIKIKRRY